MNRQTQQPSKWEHDHTQDAFQRQLLPEQSQDGIDQSSQGNEGNNVSNNDQDQLTGTQDGVAQEAEEWFLLTVLRTTNFFNRVFCFSNRNWVQQAGSNQ